MNEITAENFKKCRRQVISQLGDMSCSFDLAVTLTFSNAPKSFDIAERDFRHFMNQLNSATYGKKWRTNSNEESDQRVAVIPVHEDGHGLKQIHYHCAFATPDHMSVLNFSMQLGLSWASLQNGSKKHNEIKKIFNIEGWLDYILKEVNLLIPDNNNKIDILNMHTY